MTARERGGRSVSLSSRIADERALGLGVDLSFIAPLAASTAVDRLLDAFEPVTLKVCTRIRVRRRSAPLGFCNPYFDIFDALTDIADATSLVESFDLAPLDIRGTWVSIAAERGVVDDADRRRESQAAGARPDSACGSGWPCAGAAAGPRTVTVRVPIPPRRSTRASACS